MLSNIKPTIESEWLKVLQEEFKKNSDRGLAIVSAAFFDTRLQQLLIDFLVKDEKDDKALFTNGPLSTFSAKINMCYRLGLISKGERKTLDTIRSIRNFFAHELDNANFDNMSIRDKCTNISVPHNLIVPMSIPLHEDVPLNLDKADMDNYRELFQETVSHLNIWLSGRSCDIFAQKRISPKEYKTATEPAKKLIEKLRASIKKKEKTENLIDRIKQISEKLPDDFPPCKALEHTEDTTLTIDQMKELIKLNNYIIKKIDEAYELKASDGDGKQNSK